MLIRNYSDLHGFLPEIEPCDLLLINGDICPAEGDHSPVSQGRFLREVFKPYCESLPVAQIVIIPGNHDFVFEARNKGIQIELAENTTLLIDEGIAIEGGPRIYGQPWTPNLALWAFYAPSWKLQEKADQIPEGFDIWMQHAPPSIPDRAYWLDLVGRQHVGNLQIKNAISKRSPQLLSCGHIHEGYGYFKYHDTIIANVAFLDGLYEPQFRHMAFRWFEGPGRLMRDIEAEINPKRLAIDSNSSGW